MSMTLELGTYTGVLDGLGCKFVKLNSGAIRRSLNRVASCPRKRLAIRLTAERCAETQVTGGCDEEEKGEDKRPARESEIFFKLALGGKEGGKGRVLAWSVRGVKECKVGKWPGLGGKAGATGGGESRSRVHPHDKPKAYRHYGKQGTHLPRVCRCYSIKLSRSCPCGFHPLLGPAVSGCLSWGSLLWLSSAPALCWGSGKQRLKSRYVEGRYGY